MRLAEMHKHLAAWMAMLFASIANGAARDFLYGPELSESAAHQLSTIIGMILIGGIIRFYLHLSPLRSQRQAIELGLFWMTLTIAFEFLFFHYVGGHPWPALLANYNLLAGRIWPLLLIWIAVAPWAFFRFNTSRQRNTP